MIYLTYTYHSIRPSIHTSIQCLHAKRTWNDDTLRWHQGLFWSFYSECNQNQCYIFSIYAHAHHIYIPYQIPSHLICCIHMKSIIMYRKRKLDTYHTLPLITCIWQNLPTIICHASPLFFIHISHVHHLSKLMLIHLACVIQVMEFHWWLVLVSGDMRMQNIMMLR